MRSRQNPIGGLKPADLQSAYNVPTQGGTGVTIGIVDAYGYGRAAADLAEYRSAFHLAPCTASNGCLTIVGQNGGKPPAEPKPGAQSSGWQIEQAVDIEMVSAICPACHILLVEAKNQHSKNLYAGVATANRFGAAVISNSYISAPETEKSDPHFSNRGSTYVASAGDEGGGLKGYDLPAIGGPAQPCSFQEVVCVGGTTLRRDSSSRGWSEVTWNDKVALTGSGCSLLVKKPSWQTDRGCKMRSESDISANAGTPVAVYYSLNGRNPQWSAVQGTSVSTPLVAAMIALAENGGKTNIAARIWKRGGSRLLNDITKGSNVNLHYTGPCASSVAYICIAGPGYDGPTGWGTPNGLGAL